MRRTLESLLLFSLLLLIAPRVGAQDYRFYLTNGAGVSGSVQSIQSRFDLNASEIQGWSFGLCHDSSELSIATAAAGADTNTSNGGAAPDFLAIDLFTDGLRMGVIIDNDTINTLGIGTGYEILDVDYNLDGTGGTTSSIEYCETIGVPPVMNLVVVSTAGVVPTTEDGSILITSFRRGDFDADLTTNLADADLVLDYLFDGGTDPIDCFSFVSADAADSNDNEYITVGDYLKVRNALSGGPALPAPSATCGDDLTSTTDGFDALDTDFRLSVGDLTLLPPVGPTNRKVAFPINVDVPVPVTGITIVLEYDNTVLSPFDPMLGPPPLATPGTYSIVDTGGTLIIAIWATNDGDTLALSAPGIFQNVGTLFMNLADGFVFPPLEYAPELTLGTVLYRATIVDDTFGDHHPELLTGEFEFVRGNANSDNAVDIGDPVFILAYLFTDGPEPNCFDAADGNNDSAIDIADPVWLLNWLFGGGPIIPEPYPQCGLDVGPIDFLPCAEALPSDACFDM